jgi:hypothetical protein
MRRDAVAIHVVERLLGRPRSHRIDLEEIALEGFYAADLLPRARLVATPSVHPGADAGQEALQRLDLVDVAAEVGIAA